MLRVGSLFSGIGGIELGFERAGGFKTTWFVEWDAYAQAVLKKNWKEVPIYGDIRSIDWSSVEPIDILTGGFPCQPHSVAGKRKASADDRDLWPECRRAIEALKPKACCFENVPGLLTSEKGEFFKRIIDDFYHLGYRPRVYRLSARDVGAPHLRKRVFIVAFPLGDAECTDAVGNEAGEGVGTWVGVEGDGVVQVRRDKEEQQLDASSSYVADTRLESEGQPCNGFDTEQFNSHAQRQRSEARNGFADGCEDVADSSGDLRGAPGDERPVALDGCGAAVPNADGERCEEQRIAESGATEHAAIECGSWWAVEPDVGRVAYGVPSRVDRLKCLGNSVVPQVAEVIARIIKDEMNA